MPSSQCRMVRYAPVQRLVSKKCPKLHLLQMRTAHEFEQCMCFKLQERPVVPCLFKCEQAGDGSFRIPKSVWSYRSTPICRGARTLVGNSRQSFQGQMRLTRKINAVREKPASDRAVTLTSGVELMCRTLTCRSGRENDECRSSSQLCQRRDFFQRMPPSTTPSTSTVTSSPVRYFANFAAKR